ncbi:MAG: sulfatase family protein [Anaerolineae bacterium]
MTHRPNILLITTDTQRWDTLRCMGAPHAISPNLDHLAGEGVLFEQAHSSCPVCMPTRCSLMTGVHTHVHGCIENGFDRLYHLPVITDFLKEAGYHTAMVGKSHFGEVPETFDVQRLTLGEKRADVDDEYARFVRDRGYPRSTNHPNPVPEDLFMDAYLATTAIEEMRSALESGAEPFFVFCSLLSPHGPIDPPGRWAELYDDRELPPVNCQEGEVAHHPAMLQRLLDLEHKAITDWEALDRKRRLYYGLASYCDHQIGRLLEFLDEAGIREETLVIFTSDHGTTLGDHGFDNKHTWYDSSWHVPLILSQPGTLPSGARRGFGIWNDLATTILAAAGTSCETMQGYDLYTPLVQDEPSPRYFAAAVLYKSMALVTRRWKLEYYLEEQRGRLFDRANDPDEQVDLFDDPRHQDLRNALLRGLLAWYADGADLRGLVDRSHRGGPVARRAVAYTKTLKGLDSEERLNRLCQELDGATGPSA